MNNKGILIVLSGPSGSGKDTILDKLAEKGEPKIQLSISMTTRDSRVGEIDGVHYYFTDRADFEKKIADNEILEYAEYSGNYYGTPKAPVDKWLNEGKTVILKIEVKGAEKIRQMYPDVVSIFLMPPSMQILEDRLRNRESETEDSLKSRLSIARDEIARSEEYNYIVVNDVVDEAVNDIASIIKAELLTSARMNSKVKEVLENV